MKKLVSVTCPQLDEIDYSLTSWKRYSVIKDREDSFDILNDKGKRAYCLKKKCAHIEHKDWILNYEQDISERSREIVSELILKEFHSQENIWSFDSEDYIQAAKDFGLDELANEMEECLK